MICDDNDDNNGSKRLFYPITKYGMQRKTKNKFLPETTMLHINFAFLIMCCLCIRTPSERSEEEIVVFLGFP